MVRSPKLYFLDTGLAAHLTNWSSPGTLKDGAMSGAFFETWCVSELLKSYLHAGRQAPFFYYRDKDSREIDLLIEDNGTLFPVEFKKAASLRKDDAANFSALKKLKTPVGAGAIVSLCPDTVMPAENCRAIPAWTL
jgi:predicted AAA+ superfamily ATPase